MEFLRTAPSPAHVARRTVSDYLSQSVFRLDNPVPGVSTVHATLGSCPGGGVHVPGPYAYKPMFTARRRRLDGEMWGVIPSDL